MTSNQKNNEIRTLAQPLCYICSSPGRILYQGLADRLFNAPGKWNIKQCLNPECGLLWLDPIPTEEDIGKVYLSYYTHGDINNVSESFLRRIVDFINKGYFAIRYKYLREQITVWQKILGLLVYFDPGLKSEADFEVMYLPSQTNGRLLDVGCGDGRFIIKMRDLGWQVEGVEIDPVAVEIAKSNKLQVNLGELAEQKYPANSFDIIVLKSVIEHLCDPLDVLVECRRILKDSGSLMIITPNAKSRIHNIYKENWFCLDPPRHRNVFSPPALKFLVQKAGFKNVNIWSSSRNLRSSLIGSWDIRRKGRHKMGGWQPWSVRLWAKVLQFVEVGILKIKPDIGDEIILKVKKL